jgi:SAM-dependent methyltransferase
MTPLTITAQSDALAEMLLGQSIAYMELLAVYIGDRLGYYTALAENGDATSVELAGRTGTSERYTREWLEQQATAGILEVDDTGDPFTRRFRLPEGHVEVLTNRDSLSYMPPVLRLAYGTGTVMPALLDAYRTGGGVPYPDYGVDTREGIAEMNRVMFINELASNWMPQLPDIDARLRDASHPARVADIGCGVGWSTISMAQAYPAIRIDGFDIDEASIASARSLAAEFGVSDRVNFEVRDTGDPTFTGSYDFATAFECIHDMANPIAALACMRRLVGRGGTVLIADERVAEAFSPNGDDIERLMYGFSILHCLPVGMTEEDSAGTGTVMRTAIFRRYATEAGYHDVEVLPIDNLFWRFYRLTA